MPQILPAKLGQLRGVQAGLRAALLECSSHLPGKEKPGMCAFHPKAGSKKQLPMVRTRVNLSLDTQVHHGPYQWPQAPGVTS